MPSPLAIFRKTLRRFGRNRRGSTVVEFALIAPLFFGLLFAIIEVALVFFAGQVLETATQDSARLIMTGQAQTGNKIDPAQFKATVCGRVAALFDCGGISIDVQNYPQFSGVNVADPIVTDSNGNKNFVAPNNYNPGNPGDIVIVRVFYQWTVFVPGLGFNLANLSGNKRLLTATAAFQNEPFGSSSP